MRIAVGGKPPRTADTEYETLEPASILLEEWAMARRGEREGPAPATAATLLADADQRRRAAIATGAVAAAVIIAALVAADHWLTALRSEHSTLVSRGRYAMMSLYPCIPVVALLVVRARSASGGLIVWTRRFRPRQRHRFAFHRALDRACAGMALPVTIQDRSVPASAIIGMTRAWLMFPSIWFAWSIVPVMVWIAQVEKAISVSGYDNPPWWYRLVPRSESAVVVAALVWTLVLAWLIRRLVGRMGFRAAVGARARRKAVRRLEALRRRRGKQGLGIEVLRCDDAGWREVFDEVLRRVDAVVLDLSEPTEAILWEVARAFEHISPERILIACHEAEGGEDPARRVTRELAAAGIPHSPAWMGRALLTYPERRARGPLGRRREVRRVAVRLRAALAECLAAPITPAHVPRSAARAGPPDRQATFSDGGETRW